MVSSSSERSSLLSRIITSPDVTTLLQPEVSLSHVPPACGVNYHHLQRGPRGATFQVLPRSHFLHSSFLAGMSPHLTIGQLENMCVKSKSKHQWWVVVGEIVIRLLCLQAIIIGHIACRAH